MTQAISSETKALAEYVAQAGATTLSQPVNDKTVMHIVDSLAAVVSGSRLAPGRKGIEYAEAMSPDGSSTIVGSAKGADAVNAALANGMSAHADETDDSHPSSISHPGCAVVPAALAVAEKQHRSGEELIRAVAAGYDVGTRVGLALGKPRLDAETSAHSTHAIVGVFGAAAAASVLYGLDDTGVRHALSYAAQSTSGVTSWVRDGRHVEKAFVFGGMPASNGVRAAAMVAAGCDGVDDVFAGVPNFLDAFSDAPDRGQLSDQLGERFAVMQTNIKKFAVGSPAQAAVQATLDLLADGAIDPDTVESIQIVLPHDLARVVDGRDMPDINCQYLVAGTLLDKGYSFAMAHDDERMTAPDVVALLEKSRLVPDPDSEGVRSADLIIRTSDRGELRRFVPAVRGTVDDPMDRSEVDAKAEDLIAPLLGDDAARSLLSCMWSLADAKDVGKLAQLLEPSSGPR